MAEQVVGKKRGRPKKAVSVSEDTITGGESSRSKISKQNPKSRAFSTTEPVGKAIGTKNPSRRILDINTDSGQDAGTEGAHVQQTRNVSGKNRVLKALITEQANAFTKLKENKSPRQVQSDGQPGKSNKSAVKHSSRSSIGTARMPSTDTTSPSPNQLPTNTRSEATEQSPSPSTVSSSSKPHEDAGTFLSLFLSDNPDPLPTAAETDKISDRSAFRLPEVSINDIVTGAGVSDLSNIPSTTDEVFRQPRESAIPVRPPKSFKAHSLHAFTEAPPKQLPKHVPAQKYQTGAFASFKTISEPSIAPSPAVSSAPSSPCATASSSIQSRQIPAPVHHAQSIPHAASSQLNIAPSSSQATTQNGSSARPPRNASGPTPQPSIPHAQPRRPTQMSPAELQRDPRYRRMKWQYTGLYVGVPFLAVTSWLLWRRLDEEGWFADQGLWNSQGTREDGRVRGVVPQRDMQKQDNTE